MLTYFVHELIPFNNFHYTHLTHTTQPNSVRVCVFRAVQHTPLPIVVTPVSEPLGRVLLLLDTQDSAYAVRIQHVKSYIYIFIRYEDMLWRPRENIVSLLSNDVLVFLSFTKTFLSNYAFLRFP